MLRDQFRVHRPDGALGHPTDAALHFASRRNALRYRLRPCSNANMAASNSASYGESWIPSAVSVIERLSPSLTRRRAATSLGRIAPRELPIFLTLILNMSEPPPVVVITYVTTKKQPMSNTVYVET